jgi:predicted DNA-binding ribbon-helix-helix protein
MQEGVPLNALIAQIDAERLEAQQPCGLAGAIRIWLVAAIKDAALKDGKP